MIMTMMMALVEQAIVKTNSWSQCSKYDSLDVNKITYLSIVVSFVLLCKLDNIHNLGQAVTIVPSSFT